jgi:hypothetical protein
LKLNLILLFACLFFGIVINIGLRGLGYVAHLIVPGLFLGALVYGVISVVMLVRAR